MKNPMIKTETVNVTPAPLAEKIESLGRGISVTYAPATNSRGSRWIAKLTDGERTARATVPFSYGPGNDDGRKAAQACLEKYLNMFPAGTLPPAEIHSSATVNGQFYVYFFRWLSR